MRGECTLHETIRDISCSLGGQFCGHNMKFVLIKRSEHRHRYIPFGSCIVQCKCAEGYMEKNGQCTTEHEELKKAVSFKIPSCAVCLIDLVRKSQFE